MRRNRFAIELRQFRFHLLVAEAERRATAAVQAVKLFRFRVVNDRENVAADTVAGRFHQPERGVRGDGGIDRAAAGFENIEPDLRGERHARADHAVLREHFGTGGERLAGDAIRLSEGGPWQAARATEREKRKWHA